MKEIVPEVNTLKKFTSTPNLNEPLKEKKVISYNRSKYRKNPLLQKAKKKAEKSRLTRNKARELFESLKETLESMDCELGDEAKPNAMPED